MKGKSRRAAVPRSAGRGQKKGTPTGVPFTYGAGYGNRTRLCGLGSDHSTDELTLHGKNIIADSPRGDIEGKCKLLKFCIDFAYESEKKSAEIFSTLDDVRLLRDFP